MMPAPFSKPLAVGGAVDLWTLSAVAETDFPGEAATAFDGQGYRFVNGFVAIGDLPCRKALRATVIGRPVAPERGWPVAALRLPGLSGRIDFACFRHRPTRLARWARTVIVAAAAGLARFRLATCGGVRVWVGDAPAAVFEPYVRNVASETEIVLTLAAGANDILVLSEDMAERDTDWFFELTLVDGPALTLQLPHPVAAAAVADVARLAVGVRPERGLFVDTPLAVVFDTAAAADVALTAEVVSVHHDHTTRLHRAVTLPAGATRLELAPPGAIADGLFNLILRFDLGGAAVERALEAAVLAEVVPPPAPEGIAARKAEAARWFARHGQPRMGRVIAMMAADAVDPAALREILEITLTIVEQRHDCSDFEMVPLLWLWRRWRDRLPDDLAARTRRAILDYRYWVDEPGNDVMWYWSENHVLCFHVSQYLAGRLFPDDVFTCSGRTGADQEALGRGRLGLWFDAIDAEGLAEWNSAAYYPVDFIGLFGLDQDADAALKPRVRKLIDRLFAMIALHTMAGVPGGSQGRAYTKELLAGPLTNLAPVARIAFGTGWLNEGVAAAALFAASDYAPPASALAFAQPAAGEAIEVRYTQGVDHAGRLVVYRGRDAQLSTVVDHLTGRRGHQQHVVDVLLSGHPLARVFVNHPGEEDPSGSHRPSYWAGNGILPRVAQWRDTALLVFDVGAAEIAWTHAYLGDGLDEVRAVGAWIAVRSGRGFAALHAAGGLTARTSGPTAGHEWRSAGAVDGWVVTVAEGDRAAFERFVARLAGCRPEFDAAERRLTVALPGADRLSLSWDDGLAVDGQPAPFAQFGPDPVLTWRGRPVL
jgi:hypothetical protein